MSFSFRKVPKICGSVSVCRYFFVHKMQVAIVCNSSWSVQVTRTRNHQFTSYKRQTLSKPARVASNFKYSRFDVKQLKEQRWCWRHHYRCMTCNHTVTSTRPAAVTSPPQCFFTRLKNFLPFSSNLKFSSGLNNYIIAQFVPDLFV